MLLQNVESKESRQVTNSQESHRNVESLGGPSKNIKNGESLQNVSQQDVRSRDSLQNVEREKPDQRVDAGVKNSWHRFSDFWTGLCCCARCKKDEERFNITN